ncbi:hypothetical protein B566_EDAN014545, partial [Ephemera danica]
MSSWASMSKRQSPLFFDSRYAARLCYSIEILEDPLYLQQMQQQENILRLKESECQSRTSIDNSDSLGPLEI